MSATYHELRRRGWRAVNALNFVRDDAKLEEAENADLVSFEWVYDSDPDLSWADDETMERIKAGIYEVLGCIAHPCACDYCSVAQPPHASLWGIVTDTNDRTYLRSIEVELARELEIIR